jgi:hypothetical protein
VGLVYSAPGDNGPVEGSIQAAVNRPFADEFRVLEDNFALLEQVRSITGGRLLSDDATKNDLWNREGLTMPVALRPIWSWLALLAAGVFLVDVGVRRVRVDLVALAKAGVGLFGRAKQTQSQQIDRLQAAREQARQQMASRAVEDVRDATAAASSGVKFEANAGAKAGGVGPVIDTPRDAGGKPIATKPAGKADAASGEKKDEGMSALLKAKKRARDEMSE